MKEGQRIFALYDVQNKKNAARRVAKTFHSSFCRHTVDRGAGQGTMSHMGFFSVGLASAGFRCDRHVTERSFWNNWVSV